MAEYTLITPINKVNGEKLEVVQIKDFLTGADLKKIGNATGDGNVLIAIASAMVVGLSENYVLNMDARDVKAIAQKAKDFLDNGEG